MNISAYRADYLPLLGQLMDQMRLPQIINEEVTKPNSQAKVDAGTMISGMILNLLSDAKIRLYRLYHFFEDKPMPLILPWNPKIEPSDFTEERAGNVLDEFYRSNPQKIFSMLTHSNIKLYNINTNSIRVDTTSKSFYGAYETNMPEPIDITQGFSKDKRHDLKQIMFGTATSSDGIPILGEVMSGNTSDMTFNKGWIKTVRQALQKNDDDFLLYTADSAAVTEENLKLFKEYRVDMISRLPERYGLAEELINKAITANIWTEIGTLSEGKKAATYKSISFERELSFSINIGFEKMKHNPKAITTAMQLYFSGESLRNTEKSLRFLGIDVSHKTIHNWIGKYMLLMKQYVDKLKPNVGDTWRADEVFVKFSGDMKYLFALMDDETRYWIAQEVGNTKDRHDARNLFHEGKKIAGKRPNVLITDGLQAYHDAFNKEFYTNCLPQSKHINAIKLNGDMNNNKMERINGEIRDREKVMRGLKKTDTPILKGYQIYHNFIRTHEGLEGKTPAEACGIKVEGENKWITLIQNASNSRHT